MQSRQWVWLWNMKEYGKWRTMFEGQKQVAENYRGEVISGAVSEKTSWQNQEGLYLSRKRHGWVAQHAHRATDWPTRRGSKDGSILNRVGPNNTRNAGIVLVCWTSRGTKEKGTLKKSTISRKEASRQRLFFSLCKIMGNSLNTSVNCFEYISTNVIHGWQVDFKINIDLPVFMILVIAGSPSKASTNSS